MHSYVQQGPLAEANRRTTFLRKQVAVTIRGTSGDDFLFVASDDRNISVSAAGGNDTVVGGDGNDLLSGGAGDDVLSGWDGDDRITGGRGHDFIWGGAGNDELFGGKGHDGISGGDGDDLLEGGTGDDTLLGGQGHDTFVFMQGDGDDVIECKIEERQRQPGQRDEIAFPDQYAHELMSVSLGEGTGRMTGRDLIVAYGNDDSITIRGQDAIAGLAITHFRFADGMVVEYDQLLEMYSGENGTFTPAGQTAAQQHQHTLLSFRLGAASPVILAEAEPTPQDGYSLTWSVGDDGALPPGQGALAR